MFVGFQRHQCPHPGSHDATILNYLNDRERERHYFCRILAPPPPNAPPPPPQTLQYLTILTTERGRHYVYRI